MPTKSELDNAGFGQASAPRANYGIPIVDNSRNYNNVEEPPTPIYQNMERAVPTQQYTQQPVIAYPQPQINRTPTTPVPIVQPIIVPYAVQYPQPVNTQPTIIQQNKEDDSAKYCCCGFLTGCFTALTACCLLALCCGSRDWIITIMPLYFNNF